MPSGIRKLIERAMHEVRQPPAVRSKPTQNIYDRSVTRPRNRALVAGGAVTGAAALGYGLTKNRKRK